MQQRSQRPPCAVARKHVQVVHVEATFAVGGGYFTGVVMIQAVVGDSLAGNIEYQPVQGIALVGVRVDPPVGPAQVFVDGQAEARQFRKS